MASPSTVVTMGFGSFGSVNLVPTGGYGIGVPVVVEPNIGGWGKSPHVYVPGSMVGGVYVPGSKVGGVRA